MKRREFIAGLGAATLAPTAHAQQSERVRQIGVLIGATENDPLFRLGLETFWRALRQFGWVEGRNLRVELRFAAEPDFARAAAAALVRVAPEVIVTSTTPATRAVHELTETIPTVFILGGDVFNGPYALVKNIGRPEANITGVTNLYDSVRSKWLELLREAAPHVKRVGIIYPQVTQAPDPVRLNTITSPIEEAAPVLGVQTYRIPYRDPVDLVRGIDAFATEPNSGLIMAVPVIMTYADRQTILRLAVEHRLPISGLRETATEGGLLGYGPNTIDLFRRAASFVDRILRGAKVSDLPVEFPSKLELAINLKTAKAIGLIMPESLLLRADEVIE